MNNTGRLTIRISRHRLSFSAIDKSEEAQVRFQPYAVRSGISMAANLREAFKEDSLLTSGFTKILVDIDTPVLMVPIEEFNEDEIPIYSDLQTGMELFVCSQFLRYTQ